MVMSTSAPKTPQERTVTQQKRPRPADGDSYLFVVLAAHAPLTEPQRILLRDFNEVLLYRGEKSSLATTEGKSRQFTLHLADRWMSARHAKLRRSGHQWVLQDLGSRHGIRLNGETLTQATLLEDGDLIEIGRTFLSYRDALVAAPDAREAPLPSSAKQAMSTLLPGLELGFAALTRMAASDSSIRLSGETGTGKEVLARAIHDLSARRGPFVPVNLGALPRSLVESELFGHVRGAFTGAEGERPGLVRAAHTGTLFLDEIGDFSSASQAALLRVLQEREVRPVGGTRTIPVDIRLVTATHRDLDRLIAEGAFRPDLYARISGFHFTLPPLRDRREDLGLFIRAILQRLVPDRAASLTLEPEAARALLDHDWPLNVRELEKCLATAVALTEGNIIAEEDLAEALHVPPKAATPESAAEEEDTNDASSGDSARRAELVALLRVHKGKITAVARAMGKHHKQIQRWLAAFGINAKDFAK